LLGLDDLKRRIELVLLVIHRLERSQSVRSKEGERAGGQGDQSEQRIVHAWSAAAKLTFTPCLPGNRLIASRGAGASSGRMFPSAVDRWWGGRACWPAAL
jgi:hypothetical protein